jgi:ribonuclease HIII
VLDKTLEAYWQQDGDPERASQAIQEAFDEPPSRAKTAARTLQLAEHLDLPPSAQSRIDGELRPHLKSLQLRLRQVDQLGDAGNEPTILFEELGDEAEAINVDNLNVAALRSTRIGAGSRAMAAQKFLKTLGPEALPGELATGLGRAVEDLLDQIRHGQISQALLVGPADDGFVIGLQLTDDPGEDVVTSQQVDETLQTAASTALREVVPGRGLRYGTEWSLPFEGSSIGLPLALAALVLQGELEPDPLTAATGRVLAGGAVDGVGGVPAKLKAAADAGLARVILPEDNRQEAEASCPDGLELRFVADVSELHKAFSVPWTSAEIGVAAKKRMVRTLSRGVGFQVTDEKDIPHGYQFKLESLEAAATISIYNTGSVTVGANGIAKSTLERFADDVLRDPTPETRETLTLRLPGEALQGGVRQALLALHADEFPPREHESWRIKLARGKSAATAVLYNSSKLVLQGTAPAHDEIRAALIPLVGTLGGAEALTAPPAAQRVRDRRAASGNEPWIGTDESGKGDYFGPLVSAAVYVDPELAARLGELGAQDSKRLSDPRIYKLAPQLAQILGRRAKVTVIQPNRYNSLYAEMRAEGKNLNSLLAWGHYRSVLDLLQAGAAPRYLIVDQFADVAYIESRLAAEAERRDIEILQFPKAEADVAVAAASILAREAFLRWLQRESEELGVVLPKGAGPNVVEVAREIVETQGKDTLGRLAKLSFKTTEKVLA